MALWATEAMMEGLVFSLFHACTQDHVIEETPCMLPPHMNECCCIFAVLKPGGEVMSTTCTHAWSQI